MIEEFDDKIFNALVEKVEIFSTAHFVFELKSVGLKFNSFSSSSIKKSLLSPIVLVK